MKLNLIFELYSVYVIWVALVGGGGAFVGLFLYCRDFAQTLKGSVPQKPNGVENSANRWVWPGTVALDIIFFVMVRLHLVFTIFLFSVSVVQ